MGKKITINEVALAAQVSNGTVHRALNGKTGVSDAVRERIIKIAREMGYEPNIVASSLKKSLFGWWWHFRGRPRKTVSSMESCGTDTGPFIRSWSPTIWRSSRLPIIMTR